jgi:hypothetical protein
MPDGPDRLHAVDHLYQGQSNDCYWHGLFGGIYLVHMRMATLAHLIAAEDLADRAASGDGGADAVVFGDLDLDGQTEALLRSDAQNIVVDLAEGAGIGGWDLRATRVALAAVMRRRPEAYHDKLRAHERAVAARADAVADGAKTQTIHEIVAVKERGLSERLVYDWHERRGGLVHLLPAAEWRLSARDISAVRYTELGDFVDQPFEVVESDARSLLVRREGHLHVEGGPHLLAVSKRISTAGSRRDPRLHLELTVENISGVPVEFELALEWGFNLMGGGGNPSAYYELQAARVDGEVDGEAEGDETTDSPAHSEPGVRRWRHDSVADETCDAVPENEDGRLAFGNDDAGVRVEAAVMPGARVSWFPIETISNSEAGFERIYQGSSLVFRWPVAIEAGGRYSSAVRFQVRQSRDLDDEERVIAAQDGLARAQRPTEAESPAVTAATA